MKARMCFKQVLVFSFALFFLATLAQAAQQEKLSPKAWYLEVKADLNELIEKSYGSKISEGIYYSDQVDVWYRDDVTPLGLIDPLSFELPSLGEGAAYLGLASKNFGVKTELWLIKPSQEKFLLAIKDNSGKWVDKKFIDSQSYWLPVRGGLLTLTDKWELNIFKLAGGGNNALTDKLTVFHQTFGSEELPLIHYEAYHNRVLLGARATATVGSDDKDTDVYAIDLTTLKVKKLWEKLPWEFHISNLGIYFVENSDLYFRAVNLAHFDDPDLLVGADKELRYKMRHDADNKPIDSYDFKKIGRFFILRPNALGRKYKYTIDVSGRLTRYMGDSRRFKPTTDQDRELMRGIDHVELVRALDLGTKTPIYGMDSVNDFLATTMGAAKENWAILRYEKGQLPEELLASFVWDVRTEGIPTESELGNLDSVWQLDAERVFDIEDPDLILEYMRSLQDVVRKRNTILFLHNFPTILETEAGSGRASQLLQVFWKTFRDCLTDGTCRVVMTMRDPVFKAMNQSLYDILREAKQFIVPMLSKEEQLNVTRHAVQIIQRKKNRHVTEEAFGFIFQFAMMLGRVQASPGNEIDLIKNLFTFVDTHYRNSREIDRTIGRAWIDFIRGIQAIREQLDLDGLRKFLKEKVVGHDATIEAIVNSLKPVVNGTHFGTKPLAFNTLIGTPGVGKTYIAKLVAEYLTGRGSLLLVDMKTFGGFPSDHPVRQALSGSQHQIRVVLFDDVDQVGASDLDLLAGVVEEGVYAQGSDQELKFSNTIVFWTANWGEDIIRDRTASNQSIRQRLRRLLTEGDKPVMRRRIWSRIESHVYALRPFTEKQLFELAMVYSADHAEKLYEVKGVELKIDPRILLRTIAYEDEAQAGARSIINQLEAKVFVHYQDALANSSVRKIAMLQINDTIEVFTDRDADFQDAWDEIVRVTEEIMKEFEDNLFRSRDNETFREFVRRLGNLSV